MARKGRRARLSDAELSAIPVGDQPEEDGLLVCLECGRWYRGLGNHVTGAHGISADEYRLRHELPHGRALWAVDARQAAARRMMARVPSMVKAHTTRLTGTRDEVARSLEAQRESWQRAGTRRLKRETWARMGRDKRLRTRNKYDELARTAGYADVDDLIDKTRDQPARFIATRLGISVSGAKWLRRYHAAGFSLDHHPMPPAPAAADELAALPPGVQPATDVWVMCRECGQWLRGLARHLSPRHQMTTAQYRERYTLEPGVGLVPTAAVAANTRRRRERLDQRARQSGYADIAEFITQTRHLSALDVARRLGVVRQTVYNLRRRVDAVQL
jgi:predicted transcriptional regulator